MITRERKRSFWLYATCGVSIWAACFVSPARGFDLFSFFTPQGRCQIANAIKGDIKQVYDYINNAIDGVVNALNGAIENKARLLEASMDNKIRLLEASMDNKIRLLLEEHMKSHHKISPSSQHIQNDIEKNKEHDGVLPFARKKPEEKESSYMDE